MSTVSVNGAVLAYDEDGTGPAVVLLHAGIADRRMWQPVAGLLAAAGHRVIRYDLRGYGESSLPDAPFANHDDVIGLLDALGVARATLIGCSFGGAVAIDATIAHPDRVEALGLVGSALSGHSWSEDAEELWEKLVGTPDPAAATEPDAEPDAELRATAEAEVRFWVVGPYRQPADVDQDFLDLARTMDRHALAAEQRLGEVESRELEPPARDRLAEIAVPTLVFAGAADIPDIARLADELAARIPGAVRLADVPDAAHLLPLERPAPVAAALLGLLAGVAG